MAGMETKGRGRRRAHLVAALAVAAIGLGTMAPAVGFEVARPIGTVAGTGRRGFSGDGGRAVEASFREPRTAVLDVTGNLFVTDTFNNRVRRIDRSGVIRTVVGSGEAGFGGDGGPATAARIQWPHSLALDRAGNLFVADSANNRVRRVDTGGVITTVAGNGVEGFTGDGMPATATGLNRPKGVAVGPDGMLYIADSVNNRVRRVDARGIITTVAGTGQAGARGDGGPAAQAQLDRPRTLAFDLAGSLHVLEDEGHRIRRITPGGLIVTVAGIGVGGFSGDGGPAVLARLNHPSGMAVDRFGNLYIADSDNNRIRRVDPTGIITTVAGTGEAGFGGDGGPAVSARLDNPRGVVVLDHEAIVDGDGLTTALLVVDTMNHSLRRIAAGTGE
jgi:sugar lactone lactonase YvrE